jgi:hypothetical protein
MPKDLTLGEVRRKLEEAQCILTLNFSGGVYHAYIFQRGGSEAPVAYDRGEFTEAIRSVVRQVAGRDSEVRATG